MSSNKRGGAANEIYYNHLYGNMSNNTTVNRVMLIRKMYQRVLSELAMNRFHWDGLPDSVDQRYLELQLFFNALAVYYKDETFGQEFALQASQIGQLDMKQNPLHFIITGGMFVDNKGNIFQSKTVDAKDCVPIWANYMRIPDLDIVNLFSQKLSELERTVEINSANARLNRVIVTNNKQRLTTQNILKQIDEGQNNIQVSGSMQDLSFIQTFDLSVNPDSYEKLDILLNRTWNRAMGLLGIDNANQDKKERLVAAEVGANDEQTNLMKFVNLNARRIAAEQISKKYNRTVTVDYNTDIAARAEIAFIAMQEEIATGNEEDKKSEED
jgi:hypothetical protein